MFLIGLTLFTALAIAGAAAYVSVYGLAHLFAGVGITAIVIFGLLELGKLVATSWVYQSWDTSKGIIKWILSLFVVILMVITSMGVFGFLSKGYLDVQAPIEHTQLELNVVNEELENVRERIKFIDEEVGNYRQELKDLQAQIDNYPENYATKRRETYNDQKPRRKEIADTISKLRNEKANEMKLIKKISSERADVKKNVIEVEADIGPIKYVAALFGIPEDQAVRAMIILVIFVFDPLAVLLLIAANISIAQYLGKKKAGMRDLFKKTELVEKHMGGYQPDPVPEESIIPPPKDEGIIIPHPENDSMLVVKDEFNKPYDPTSVTEDFIFPYPVKGRGSLVTELPMEETNELVDEPNEPEEIEATEETPTYIEDDEDPFGPVNLNDEVMDPVPPFKHLLPPSIMETEDYTPKEPKWNDADLVAYVEGMKNARFTYSDKESDPVTEIEFNKNNKST